MKKETTIKQAVRSRPRQEVPVRARRRVRNNIRTRVKAAGVQRSGLSHNDTQKDKAIVTDGDEEEIIDNDDEEEKDIDDGDDLLPEVLGELVAALPAILPPIAQSGETENLEKLFGHVELTGEVTLGEDQGSCLLVRHCWQLSRTTSRNTNEVNEAERSIVNFYPYFKL